jgi:hypothetical protein
MKNKLGMEEINRYAKLGWGRFGRKLGRELALLIDDSNELLLAC